MKKQFPLFRTALVILAILVISFSSLMAKDVIIRMEAKDLEKAGLLIRNNLVVIAEEDGMVLTRCSKEVENMLAEEDLPYHVISSYDHLTRENLPPKENGAIPIGVVVDRGSQGMGGWHQGVAMAGSVLAYMETHVDGQLPGFTFWDMEKDSTWHHFIDTELDSDEPLYISSGGNKICYTFHFSNPEISNSDMRYYWYDVSTGEHGEVENFGYGFEGFGVSDTWMMRVGNKGMGWNNQIFAHNMKTGDRFEILADSVNGSWGYNYDNLGGPKTDGNTVVYKYIDYETYTPDLMVRSLGADGIFGTADDVAGILSQTGGSHTATSFGQYRVKGRYIVWVERTNTDDGNIRAYDMGEDELYGTADDGTVMDICLNSFAQSTVRIDDDIIIWEDKRNVTVNGTLDIYGYDLETSTEFRSTPTPDSLTLVDFHRGEAILVKPDWDETNNYNDIYFANVFGRIQSDYYRIDIMAAGNPQSISYLNSDIGTSPYSFGNIIRAAKGPLGAIFVKDLPSGNDIIMSYSAVTGDWDSELISFPAKDYMCMMDGDNGLVVGKKTQGYEAWTFNGATGSFSAKSSSIQKPTGFAVGNNIAFIWREGTNDRWLSVYDANKDSWSAETGTNNDPWHVITTDFSDSLGLLVYGQGDTLCSSVGAKVYDLALGDWSYLPSTHYPNLSLHTYPEVLKVAMNDHLLGIAWEYDHYFDYIYAYGTGSDEWKEKTTYKGYDLDKPLLGDNFIVQGVGNDNAWQGHIFNNISGEWLSDFIDGGDPIDDLLLYDDLLIAWKEYYPYSAVCWAYSSASGDIVKKTFQYPGNVFQVEAGSKFVFVYENGSSSYHNKLHVFNGIKGEWNAPVLAAMSPFELSVSGHTGIFLERSGFHNGVNVWTAHGYSALKDAWDSFEYKSNSNDKIFTSDFCGLLIYDHYIWQTTKYFRAFNTIEAEWSDDELSMHHSNLSDLSMDDRIMLVTENGLSPASHSKAHAFSPFLDKWTSTQMAYGFEFDGYGTTPTSAFVWDGYEFKIIFSDNLAWQKKNGRLDELHVTDYAIAATMYHSSQTNTYHFYPPRTEIVNEFEFTEGPDVNILSSWAAEVVWKTNLHSDTRLVWGVDGFYEIIQIDTLEDDYTKDHRVLIEGLEANKTYYYGVASVIANVDTVMSDTLMFNTGADSDPPVLAGAPTPYRIHDNEASVWWETDEPSTPIIQWGLTTAYTDTSAFDGAEPSITNAIRMYDLLKDTTYHYRVGGYDRYGNGPFFSGDYTFRTENPFPVVTELAQADSALWGAAYMTWEPPRLDSVLDKETFDKGIPVDWKIYNRGDNKKGLGWTSGYLGDNAVAYCSYGEVGERQEEWLISNPITIGSAGAVLNFWHMGHYVSYDNAPNKVMISWTGTDVGDFSTVWSSQDLPTDWSLVQIDLNYAQSYGKTMYIAFVYESTNGEIWSIDNVYLDNTVDGYYEDFSFDNNFWNEWTKAPMPSGFGIKSPGGNDVIGVDSYDTAPDNFQEEDSWVISPFLTITESHHLLGFWHYGWWQAMDNAPNEVRVVTNIYSYEASSTVVKSIYPVPDGWRWETVDLSAYVGQTIRIAFRYHSYAGWLWNGNDWSDWYGETWYIDDMYLFENAPAMVVDPNARSNEKPMKFASKPGGRPIKGEDFSYINSSECKLCEHVHNVPTGKFELADDKLKSSVVLPQITQKAGPSALAEPMPVLLGYEVYGRFPGYDYYEYLGYVRQNTFVDWNTHLGYQREYYVEAVYDKGNSQPSNKAIIAGGVKYAENEYGYDTGVLYYSYWWRPGTAFANEFDFGDSVLNAEQVKVHIANPGSFKISISTVDNTQNYVEVFSSNTIQATQEGWHTVDLPIPTGTSFGLPRQCLVEFQPQDTLVQLSYDYYENDPGISWEYNGSQWRASNNIYFIRLIGYMGHPDNIAEIPNEFKLSQNYPNPFNPITSIEFDLPEASDMTLKVYDVRGALVATLADGHREAGKHKVVWNAKNMKGVPMASGVYLIKMTAGEFSSTKKMTLLR